MPSFLYKVLRVTLLSSSIVAASCSGSITPTAPNEPQTSGVGSSASAVKLSSAVHVRITEYALPSSLGAPGAIVEESNGALDYASGSNLVRYEAGSFSSLTPAIMGTYEYGPMTASANGPIYTGAEDAYGTFGGTSFASVSTYLNGTLKGSYPVGSFNDVVAGVATDSKGTVWITDGGPDIARVANFPNGPATGITLPSGAVGIAYGPEKSVWVLELAKSSSSNASLVQLSARSPISVVRTIPVPYQRVHCATQGDCTLVAGFDGALWFTANSGSEIFRMTTGGAFERFPTPSGSVAIHIAAGADKALWFTDPALNEIGRITKNGRIRLFAVPTRFATVDGITGPPLGASGCNPNVLWFTEATGNKLGEIMTE